MTTQLQTHDQLADLIDSTLTSACAALAAYQAPDGHFDGATEQGTAPTAQTVIIESYLGILERTEAAAAVEFLSRWIREDGGVPAYTGAQFPALSETCCVYAALVAAGVSEEDPRRRRLLGYIESGGGFSAVDPLTQAFMVMAGVLPAAVLPPSRIEHVLVPGIERHVGRSFITFYGMTLTFLLPGLLYGLRHFESSAKPGRLARAACDRIVDYLIAHQNPDGNWAGSQWITGLALACLRALKVPRGHDAVVRGIKSLAQWKRRRGAELTIMPFNADVWNTAMALRVLRRACYEGASSWTERAMNYLLAAQSALPGPIDWLNAAPLMPRTGGWSFEANNPLMSDCDTTAMVLAVLAEKDDDARVREAIHRGHAWLVAMQNDCGGFAAFSRGQRMAPPVPLFTRSPKPPRGAFSLMRFFTRPPYELVDMPTADLTARVLCALGRLGHDRDTPVVKQALRFLYAQRQGAVWAGRWTTNYLAATAFVLQGLSQVGEDMRRDEVRRAIDWMLAHQNQDGGFGERNETYMNPSLAGTGPSNAYLTALVLHALCVSHEATGDSARRAAEYLCHSQMKAGLWDEFQAVQSMAPPDLFYKNFVNFQTAPIEALAVFRELALRPLSASPRSISHRQPARWELGA